MAAPEFFNVKAHDRGWRDLDSVFLHGWPVFSQSGEMRDDSGRLLIGRTGPYVPRMFSPFSVSLVVRDDFKSVLEYSGLGPFEFREVRIGQAVPLDWNGQPGTMPNFVLPRDFESGPEEYLTEQPHSEALAQQLPRCWELLLERGINCKMVLVAKYQGIVNVFSRTWSGQHVVLGDLGPERPGRLIIVDRLAKDWLEARLEGEFRFDLCPVLDQE